MTPAPPSGPGPAPAGLGGPVTPDELRRLHDALARAGGGSADDARGLVAAAHTALRLQRPKDAHALARAALVAAPNDARAWSALGAALEAHGDGLSAKDAYERALNFDDKDLATAVACAELCARLGFADEAHGLATWVLLREENAPALRARALALVGLDDDDDTTTGDAPAAAPSRTP